MGRGICRDYLVAVATCQAERHAPVTQRVYAGPQAAVQICLSGRMIWQDHANRLSARWSGIANESSPLERFVELGERPLFRQPGHATVVPIEGQTVSHYSVNTSLSWGRLDGFSKIEIVPWKILGHAHVSSACVGLHSLQSRDAGRCQRKRLASVPVGFLPGQRL